MKSSWYPICLNEAIRKDWKENRSVLLSTTIPQLEAIRKDWKIAPAIPPINLGSISIFFSTGTLGEAIRKDWKRKELNELIKKVIGELCSEAIRKDWKTGLTKIEGGCLKGTTAALDEAIRKDWKTPHITSPKRPVPPNGLYGSNKKRLKE